MAGDENSREPSDWDPPPPYTECVPCTSTTNYNSNNSKISSQMQFSASSHLPPHLAPAQASVSSGGTSVLTTTTATATSGSGPERPPNLQPNSYFNLDFVVTDTSYSSSAVAAQIQRQNESQGQGGTHKGGCCCFISDTTVYALSCCCLVMVGIVIIVGIVALFTTRFL